MGLVASDRAGRHGTRSHAARRRGDRENLLVARDRETSSFRRAEDAAVRRHGTALVVAGGPGAGKSALLDHFAITAAHELTAVPACLDEQAIAGALVERLLLRLAPARPGPPDVTSDDAHRALGRTLLKHLEERRAPLTLLVDDVHLADELSRRALLYAARRLAELPVVLVLSERASSLELVRGLEVLVLDDLHPSPAGELLRRRSGGVLAPLVADALVEATGGNPLGLVEAVEHLGTDVLSGESTLPRPLPATPGVVRAFGPALEPFGPETLSALGALALLGAGAGGGPVSSEQALRAAGIPVTALDAALERAVVRRSTDGIAFAHPLLAGVAVAALSPSTERNLRTALSRIETARARNRSADADAPLPWELRLLGGFELRRGAERLELAPALSHLVKVVALREVATVDTVVDDLWPDASPETGRARLRNVLSRTRAACRGLVVRDGELLRLEQSVSVDLRLYVEAAEYALGSIERHEPEAMDLAVRAAALYGGELLPGDRFAPWSSATRAYVNHLELRLLDLLAGVAADQHRTSEAVRLLEQMAALAPYDQQPLLRAADLLQAAGHRGAAASLRRRSETLDATGDR